MNPTFPTVLDSTQLEAFRNCPQQFFLGYCHNWHLQGESVHLHAGAAYAHGLEVARKVWASGIFVEEECLALGLRALCEAYGDFDSGDSPKSLSRMCGALEYYFSQYSLERDPAQVLLLNGAPAVEWSFAIPLPLNHPSTGEPLLYAGRFDAVVHFANANYALDDKTTSSLGASWSKSWDMRGQFTSYAWAMREHGLHPAGTIVRGVSILKTKYETAQAIISQADWKIDRWYADTLLEVQEMLRCWESGEWRRAWGEPCNHYGGCPFKQCCLVKDPTPWLQSYYEQRPWNPLER